MAEGGSNPHWNGRSPHRPRIMRVPEAIRRGNEAAYTPMFVSIGPFNRDIPELEGAEQLKWSYLKDLIQRSPGTNSVDRYITAVRERVREARKHYFEEFANMPNDEFVEMLVVDGCFIVEFLVKFYTESLDVQWYLPLLQYDILLLENQIPFFVLKLLFDNTDNILPLHPYHYVHLHALTNLALHYLYNGMIENEDIWNREEEIHHLLHLHHLSLVRNSLNLIARQQHPRPMTYLSGLVEIFTSRSLFVIQMHARWIIIDTLSLVIFPVIYFLLLKLWNMGVLERSRYKIASNARKLQESGVNLKSKETPESMQLRVLNPGCLEVYFDEGERVLEMPLLSLDERTVSSLRNLIAFEQYHLPENIEKRYCFTAYAFFMNEMIKTTKDVDTLEECGIIQNKIGTSKDAVKLFRDMIRWVPSVDNDNNYLKDAFKRIHNHMEFPTSKWRALLVNQYFHSPWAVLSTVVGLLALAISVTQLVLTIRNYNSLKAK